MAGTVISGFSKHKNLFEMFKLDPLKAVKELEKKTKGNFGKLNVSDIEVLKELTFEELELLASIYSKTKGNIKPFKLG